MLTQHNYLAALHRSRGFHGIHVSMTKHYLLIYLTYGQYL